MRVPQQRWRRTANLLIGVALAMPFVVAVEPVCSAAAAEEEAGAQADAAPEKKPAEEAEGEAGDAPAGAPGKAMTEAEAAAAAKEVLSRLIGETYKAKERLGRPIADEEILTAQYVGRYGRDFRPLMTTELRFIARVCEPSLEELRTLQATGEAVLADVVQRYSDVALEQHRRGYAAEPRLQFPDPRVTIHDALHVAVEETLSADHARRYDVAIAKRNAARKEATIGFVVAELDSALLFSPDQREQFTSTLRSIWEEPWSEALEVLRHGEDYFPRFPDEKITPILTEIQQELWETRQRTKRQTYSYGYFRGYGFTYPIYDDVVVPPDDAAPPAGAEADGVEADGVEADGVEADGVEADGAGNDSDPGTETGAEPAKETP